MMRKAIRWLRRIEKGRKRNFPAFFRSLYIGGCFLLVEDPIGGTRSF